jgi:hypothetical protein
MTLNDFAKMAIHEMTKEADWGKTIKSTWKTLSGERTAKHLSKLQKMVKGPEGKQLRAPFVRKAGSQAEAKRMVAERRGKLEAATKRQTQGRILGGTGLGLGLTGGYLLGKD